MTSGDRVPVSVAIIALDEERNLARCLRSVDWAAERVVVDTGSTDRTVEIARREGARVVTRPWEGFVATKNRAIGETSEPWVLSLDADEWITPAGADEIRHVLADPKFDVYGLPRRPAFLGAFVDRAWSPDVPLRLFRRDAARFAGGPVHESLRPLAGRSVGRLRVAAPHLTYRTLADYLARMNRYTDLAADGLVQDERPARPMRLVASPLAAFVRTYVAKRGFLDGRRGLIVAVGSAFYAFLKHAKHWERGRDVSEDLRRLATPTPEDPDPAARPTDRRQSG